MSEAETRAKKDVVDSERPRPESGRATGLEARNGFCNTDSEQ